MHNITYSTHTYAKRTHEHVSVCTIYERNLRIVPKQLMRKRKLEIYIFNSAILIKEKTNVEKNTIKTTMMMVVAYES